MRAKAIQGKADEGIRSAWGFPLSVHLIPGTLRDLSYVASRLRPEDLEEVDCQYDEWSPAALAASCMRGQAYVVEINGNPEAAVGAMCVAHKGLWVAWSWGSRRMWRGVPTITEFVRNHLIPSILEQGGQRCEARAMSSHTGAHRWLKRMGAVERCELPAWGKSGEPFKLFDWTRDHVLQPIGNVRQQAISAGLAADVGNSDDRQ